MQKLEAIAFLGHGNKQSNTFLALMDFVNKYYNLQAKLILDQMVCLCHVQLAYYYGEEVVEDDFLSLVNKILQVDHIIIATPMYWYSVSAITKVFLDRFAQLTMYKKEIGRLLLGKKLIFVVSYGGYNLPPYFDLPLKQMCAYLGLNYGGSYFYKKAQFEIEKL